MPWFVAVQLTVAVPLILLNWYVGRRVARSLATLRPWAIERVRRVLLYCALILNALPVVAALTFWVGGRRATQIFEGESVWVDAVLVYPFWTWLVILVQAAFILAVLDLGTLLRLWVRGKKALGTVWYSRSVVGVVALAALYSVITVVIDSTSARVRTIDVDLPPFAAALDGFRILHISDVQGDGRTTESKIHRFIEQANELKADVVLNSGDIVTSGESYIVSTASLLGSLTAPYGHYLAVGDHDIFSNKNRVMTELRRVGIQTWEDSSIVLEWRSVPVKLSLLTYTYPRRPDSSTVASVLETPESLFHIVLVHQPARTLVQRAADSGVHLFLAGHTHGGGVAFGVPGVRVFSPAGFESPYVSGRYDVRGMVVNVTNGLGFTLAPIRFHAPLEMSLIRLRTRLAEGQQRP